MTEKSKSMVKTQDFKIASIDENKIKSLLSECGVSEIRAFDLERVKFPSRDDVEWSVPDINSKTGYTRTDEIIGVIISYQDTRSYWVSDYETNPDQPPDCFSDDLATGKLSEGTVWAGTGEPSGDCKTCQYAQFESDPKGGDAQACKIMRNLMVITPDKMLPILLSVGPGSYKECQKFFFKLASSCTTPSTVVIGFSLYTSQSKGGVKFPKLKMRVIEKLSDDTLNQINAFKNYLQKQN